MKPAVCASSLALLGIASIGRAGALPDIYPSPEAASQEIAVAFKQAMASHKRIILDFGGNWCPDCRVLDGLFHDATNGPLLDAGYILIHVNIGHRDRNLDLADKFQVPLAKGVPALAVVDENGNLLYSQRSGEFQDMHQVGSTRVTEFLARWQSPNVIR